MRIQFHFLLLLVIFASNLCSFVEVTEQENGLVLSTLYGKTLIQEPIVIELITSPAFQRLKNIHQYGVYRYSKHNKEQEYTRYLHSLGVFFLTRTFGAPLQEQIAALLHDVSHTVFSHVGDVFFKSEHKNGKDAYQDTIHEWYLDKAGVTTILKKYGFDTICSSHEKKRYRCFDQELPFLCADRIEYNITGAFLANLLTQDDIAYLIDHLRFSDGAWYFTDTPSAKKFGQTSMQLCKTHWGSAYGIFMDCAASRTLHRAHALHLITLDDIHFSTDDIVWAKLLESNDPYILQHIEDIQNSWTLSQTYQIPSGPLHLTGRFTGTDPLVLHKGQLYPLSTLDAEYKEEFDQVRMVVTAGYFFGYIE